MSGDQTRAALHKELYELMRGNWADSADEAVDVILRHYVVLRPPTVWFLAPHETFSTRYRDIASDIRAGRGGWGSNMRESIARTLDAISDAMEGITDV